jgi:cytochrome c-type biogenesis protein CcmH
MKRVAPISSVLVCAAMLIAQPALAVQPDEILTDADLEKRARALSAELRCLVCQNQSIDDSDAPLARDLRLLVRERLKAGDSDTAVREFVVARYGSFVLLKPPVTGSTLLLWLAPLAALLVALGVAWRAFVRQAPVAAGAGVPPALDAAEKARLEELLKGEEKA